VNDLEYLGKVNPKPLSSLEQDFKRERAQFQKDELDRALRRLGKLVKPEPEITYERFPEDC
jgi:hypothetical protein